MVFNYKYKTGNTFFSNRPKFLDKVTCFRELEYLIYPFTLFRITEVIPPTDEKNYYDIVLSINWDRKRAERETVKNYVVLKNFVVIGLRERERWTGNVSFEAHIQKY